jgi:hypothetical protein
VISIGIHAAARRSLLGTGGALLLMGCAGCGGSASVASVPTSATHQFTATLTVTGALTKSADFTMDLTGMPSCATLAQVGYAGTALIPVPATGTLELIWTMNHYPGPGTYTDPSLFAGSVLLDAPYGAGTDQFAEVTGSVLSLTVNADGSGSATFQNLQDAQSVSVSGTETWTCS